MTISEISFFTTYFVIINLLEAKIYDVLGNIEYEVQESNNYTILP